MTPIRTDTTLRQKRRALKHINLNNLDSPDATRSTFRPGARQTAARPRVNNEQESSNSMSGEYTREQIINWVMSKDAIASCFIKDVLSMSESGRGGGDALANFVCNQLILASDRSSLLPSRSCALQVCFLRCHRSRSCSIRTSHCLHT